MINTQKLVEYIESAPFPRAEKDRLITLACVANEEHQRHIYLLVKKFTERIEQEKLKKMVRIREKSRYVQTYIRKKGEEFCENKESEYLQNLKEQFTTL